MTTVLNHRLVRKFGLWYLAYEAVSFIAFLTFGSHFARFI